MCQARSRIIVITIVAVGILIVSPLTLLIRRLRGSEIGLVILLVLAPIHLIAVVSHLREVSSTSLSAIWIWVLLIVRARGVAPLIWKDGLRKGRRRRRKDTIVRGIVIAFIAIATAKIKLQTLLWIHDEASRR